MQDSAEREARSEHPPADVEEAARLATIEMIDWSDNRAAACAESIAMVGNVERYQRLSEILRAYLSERTRREKMEEALRGRAIIQHVRMTTGGGTVKSGQSCALCKTEWGGWNDNGDKFDPGVEHHEPGCLLESPQ